MAGWLAAGCTLAARAHAPEAASPAPGLWFDDLRGPGLVLSAQDHRAILGRARAHLGHAPLPDLPAHLALDREARIVLVSVTPGDRAAVAMLGAGQGLLAALDQACARIRAHAAWTRPERLWLKVDVVRAAEPLRWTWREPVGGVDLGFGLGFGLGLGLESAGIAGLAFPKEAGLVLFAEELTLHRLLDDRGALRRRRLRRHQAAYKDHDRGHAAARWLKQHGAQMSPVPVWRFWADSAFSDGATLTVLRAGVPPAHRADHAAEVTAGELRRAALAGAAYIRKATGPEGRFVYAYEAAEDRGRPSYNMVRHAGTIFALMDAYSELRDPALLAAAERAIAYMRRFLVRSGRGVAVVEHNKIKLGGVALSVLALAAYMEATSRRDVLELAQGLGRYLLASQRPDGSFVHQRSHPGGAERRFISRYYPGEAIFALTALHRLDADPAWLDAAERAAHYLIDVRDRDVATDELLHDHWLLYGLNALYRVRPDPRFRAHALRIASAIVAAPIAGPKAQAKASTLGGRGAPSRPAEVRVAGLATRLEGLMAAYVLARDVGEAELASAILDAARARARILVAMQLGRARAMYLPSPARAEGGFPRTERDDEVRIDYVQHSLSALLALMRALPPGQP